MTIAVKHHEQAKQFVKATSAWMSTRLKVVSKPVGNEPAKLVPFVPNGEQMRFNYHMGLQQAAGFPVRLIVLKARRIGISTDVAGMFFMDCQTRPNRYATMCSYKSDSADTIFAMVQKFKDSIPEDQRHEFDRSNKKELRWSAPWHSHFQVVSARDVDPGHSTEIHNLHCSEVARYQSDPRILNGLLNGVARNAVDTMAILESTAWGVGGIFYDRYTEAVKRWQANPDSMDGFLPLFFSWLDFSEYKKSLPHGFALGRLSDDEQFLRSLNATDEQIYWWRGVVEDHGGDVAQALENYPATWEQAFQYSGRQYFPANVLAHHQEQQCPPLRRVRFESINGRAVMVGVDDTATWCWEVWDEPDPQDQYAVGGDVAEGKLSDKQNEKSPTDFSTGVVLNRNKMRFEAVMQGRMDPDVHGRQLKLCAEFYNHAWVTPEFNKDGHASLIAILGEDRQGYDRVYKREVGPDAVDQGETARYGWRTTSGANGTRQQMIDDYRAACRPQPGGEWSGSLIVRSDKMIHEEQVFVLGSDGLPRHRPAEHDDILFAAFIALQLHKSRQCPMERRDDNYREQTEVLDKGQANSVAMRLAYPGQIMPRRTMYTEQMETR